MPDKTKKPPNLLLRILIGIPAGGITFCVFAFGDFTLFLFTEIGVWIALQEFWKLTGVKRGGSIFPTARMGEIAAVILIYIAWFYPSAPVDNFLAFLLPLIFVTQLLAVSKGDKIFIREVAMVILGVFYIAGFASFLFKLRDLQLHLQEIGVVDFSDPAGFFQSADMNHFIIFVGLASWGSDTAAYFAGKFFGRSQLAPTISPRKTITGLIGGMFGSATCVTFYAWFIGLIPVIQWQDFIAFGAFAGAFSQLGDLTVSAIKREVQLKDSGRMLGAHGGILDRCDGFLFALPATYVFFAVMLGSKMGG